MSAVGTLTSGALATVDERGRVVRKEQTLAWRVRVGDHWVDPAVDVTVRRARPGAAPIFETAVRVPGGDAVGRVYAVGERGGLVVAEVENRSPEAVAVAFVVEGGRAESLLARSSKPGAIEADGALIFPVPHRVTVRVALGDPETDVRSLPDAEAVTRAWNRILERGMRTELPGQLQATIDAARADLLLAPPAPETFVALEAWGFDDEAVVMWSMLGVRGRRTARRRAAAGDDLLMSTRAALVREEEKQLDVLPGFVPEWLGQNLAVHEVPLRGGRLSYALRWHGERPALLWEAPPGCELRASALDPSWSSTEATGETLLGVPPAEIVGSRTSTREPLGSAPESFS